MLLAAIVESRKKIPSKKVHRIKEQTKNNNGKKKNRKKHGKKNDNLKILNISIDY